MKCLAIIVATLGLAAPALAAAVEGAEANEGLELSTPLEARSIGCASEGTPRKPAVCAKPVCPRGYRSVFWDYGCPNGSWKCCI